MINLLIRVQSHKYKLSSDMYIHEANDKYKN